MNAFAPSNQLPMLALFRACIEESWKPNERRRHRSAVRERHDQLIVRELDMRRNVIHLDLSQLKSVHSMLSGAPPGVRLRSVQCDGARERAIGGSVPCALASVETW